MFMESWMHLKLWNSQNVYKLFKNVSGPVFNLKCALFQCILSLPKLVFVLVRLRGSETKGDHPRISPLRSQSSWEEVTLPCEVKSLPPPVITWAKETPAHLSILSKVGELDELHTWNNLLGQMVVQAKCLKKKKKPLFFISFHSF